MPKHFYFVIFLSFFFWYLCYLMFFECGKSQLLFQVFFLGFQLLLLDHLILSSNSFFFPAEPHGMQDLGSSVRDWIHTHCTGVMASQPLGSQGSTPKFLRDSTLYVLFSFCLSLCRFYSSTFKFIDSLLSWVPISGIHLPPALLAFALDSFLSVASLGYDSLWGFACCLPYPLEPVFIIQLFPMSVSCLWLLFQWLFCLLGGCLPCFSCVS